jgi:two-component system sensor histidine kinase BarA
MSQMLPVPHSHMTDLRFHLHGDSGSADRLRDVLSREGFRIVESPESQSEEITVTETAGDQTLASPETLALRIESLERTVRELRNLDVAKSQFLANVSHELRTPLTAIVTYGEVLRDGLLGEINGRQREAVQSVIGSSRQLLSMIEEILIYARTNARAIELQPTEWEIGDVVGDVYQMNASLIRQKQLRYACRVDPDVPAIRADRDKVIHVLGNLIGNAIEFTAPDGLLHVKARRSPSDATWVEVVVEDNGIGIDPEHHEMIFREFAQVDSSRARRHHGTGLGLAIARNFIQLHGGEIWVESEPDVGSRFFFTLPSVEAEQQTDAA